MKSVFLVISALFSTFSGSQSMPQTYKFAVDPPECKSAVVIDSLLCIWNGSTISYTAKCHSKPFVTENRNVLMRFTLSGTVPHSTIEIVHGVQLMNQTGGTFEINGSFPYSHEPNMSWVFATYKDVTGPDDAVFRNVKDRDVIIPKELGVGYIQQDEQLLIFNQGKQ